MADKSSSRKVQSMHCSQGHLCSCVHCKQHDSCHDAMHQSATPIPIAVFLKVTGDILAGEALRTAAHSLQNLAGNSFVNTQSLHSAHKLIVQFTCPLNLHHTTPCLSTWGIKTHMVHLAAVQTDHSSLTQLVCALRIDCSCRAVGSDWSTSSLACHK